MTSLWGFCKEQIDRVCNIVSRVSRTTYRLYTHTHKVVTVIVNIAEATQRCRLQSVYSFTQAGEPSIEQHSFK